MEFVTTLATVPAIIALVTLAKDLGLPSKLSPLVAVVLGVALSLFDMFATGIVLGQATLLQAISTGLILGLSAAGLYDASRAIGTKNQGAIVVQEDPSTKPEVRG